MSVNHCSIVDYAISLYVGSLSESTYIPKISPFYTQLDCIHVMLKTWDIEIHFHLVNFSSCELV